MSYLNIALKDLNPSPRNVRKTGGQSVDDLAASINHHGLLQNLTVIQSGKGYEVVAGARRLAALKLLAKQKFLTADYKVPCLLVADNAGAEASIAENTIREAMHPADQFEAFRQLIDGGKSIADTAAAFGVAESVVKQRLKLANVSPRLLVEYRTGNATLEQMQALAISDDHAAQEAVWSQGEDNHWQRQPHHLRRALTETEVPSTDNRVLFVGLHAYEAAGGVVRRDLFGSNAYLQDTVLLDRLVTEKLEDAAEELRTEGWAWVEVRSKPMTWSERSAYASAGKPKRRAFTDDEQAAYDAIEARAEALDDIMDSADGDMEEAIMAERAQLNAEMREIANRRDTWSAKIKASAGAVVHLDDDGIEIIRGVLKPGQRLGANTGGDDADPVIEDTKPKKDPAALSQSAIERLHGSVTSILRSNISSRAALAALAAKLWNDVEVNNAFIGLHDTVTIGKKHTPIPPAMAEEIGEWTARPFDLYEVPEEDVFGWLLTQPERVSIEIITHCAAVSIVARHDGPAFAAKVGINLADHWQVSEEWLATQPKGHILATLAEMGHDTTGLDKLKAVQLAELAASRIAAGWLPKELRTETE